MKLTDPEYAAWSRRQFAKAAALGGGAAFLSSLWARTAFAQTAQPAPAAQAAQAGVAGVAARSKSEIELDTLASNHPHLHTLCTDALAQMKYAFTAVAAGKAGAGNEFADTCRPFVAARKPRTKAAYEKGASALLAAPLATREAHFGHYAAIAPATFVTTRLTALPKPARPAKLVTLEDLRSVSLASSSVIEKLDDDDDKADKKAADKKKDKNAHAKDIAEGEKWKQVEFYINEVKCIDNTGGLLEGTDEIAMGGVATGTTGGMKKIKQFHVKDGFDTDSDKNTKKYKGGKSFATFEIHPTVKLPHEYIVTMSMAELDSGGFGDFLESLWKNVKGYVTAALAAAGGAIAGAISLSWIPGIGTVIGAIIGAFIGWLVGLFHNDDDIVGTKTRVLRLGGISKSYYEKVDLIKGIPVTVDFADEGHYRVTGGWRLVAP